MNSRATFCPIHTAVTSVAVHAPTIRSVGRIAIQTYAAHTAPNASPPTQPHSDARSFARKRHLLEDRLHDALPEERLDEVPDERLRLVFTCCHPALALPARVALTLRTVAGLTTPEIARAFLVQESTMAQRLGLSDEALGRRTTQAGGAGDCVGDNFVFDGHV